MKKISIGLLFIISVSLHNVTIYGQAKQEVIDAILAEGKNSDMLEILGSELMDDIGPRLVGSPSMYQAHQWAVSRYQGWGINAENQQYGEWLGWERGITHVDMIAPRVLSLEGRMLAWSAPSGKVPIVADVITIPSFQDSISFKQWLPTVKGKIVMASKYEITGRPESSWKEFALEEDYKKIIDLRSNNNKNWLEFLSAIGQSSASLHKTLEDAGAAAIVTSSWSGGWGANRIFGTKARKVPVLDIRMEDYSMMYRLIQKGVSPKLRIVAESRYLGKQPTYNTIATLQGGERGQEIVMLSGHFDSWDGGTGATDNGTGTILLMEVMRILKKVYPNPRRTIMAGHWGSEEQGLNGSRAFVTDHPELHSRISVLFNQDNGTGRVNHITGQGFLHAYDYFNRWLGQVPSYAKDPDIKTIFPSVPDARGNSDHASFVQAGIPAFFMLVNNYDYGTYTWHTQLDTYDKINFEDVRRNAVLFATLVYLACEEQEMFDRTPALLPMEKDGKTRRSWPKVSEPTRLGGFD